MLAGRFDREAVVDEPALRDVELADDDRVGAAVGQHDQRTIAVRLEDELIVEHPLHALRFTKRIEVDQRLPVRVAAAPARPSRAPPQALRMLFVLPDVVRPVLPALRNHRALARQQRPGEALDQRAIVRFVEPGRIVRAGVLRVDPADARGAVQFFEELMRIGLFGPGSMRHGVLCKGHGV